MVGYRDGDPSRPYVMGSLFHRDNSKGAAKDNNLKTISTKSGHLIEFNDDESGDWGITIKDRNGNIIQLDTAGKNIEVTAPETMTLNAKNMKVNVDENMELNIGQDVTSSIGNNRKTDVGGDIETTAMNKKEVIEENSDINIGKKLSQITNEATMLAEGGDFIVKAEGKVLIQGTSDARISKG